MKNKSKKGLFAIVVIFLLVAVQQANSQNQIVGQVAYGGDTEYPLSNVDVELYDLTNTLVLSTLTDANGFYNFNNVPNGEYYIRALSNDEEGGVIDLNDAYYIMMHLLGGYELTDVQYEVADVDNSSTVTWNDYILIVVNYLLYNEPFPAGPWQFEENYVNLSARGAGDTIVQWGAMEGDVFIDWETSGRSTYDIVGDYKSIELTDQPIQVAVETNINDKIGGYDLNLQYPAELVNILQIEGPDDNVNYTIDENTGQLHLIWLNEYNINIDENQLVLLTVEPKTLNTNAEGLITLLPGSMMLNSNGTKIEEAEVTLPLFKQTQVFEFEVTTYPNPVVNQLNIDLTLPEATTARLMVYDMQGRLIEKQDNINLTEGKQVVAVNAQKYMPGHYLYVFEMMDNIHETIQGRFYRSH